MGRFTRYALVVLIALAAASAMATAATPPSATLTPDASGKGSLTWTGTAGPGTTVGGSTDDCFDANGKPDTTTSGCDFFTLTVNAPSNFYDGFLGGVQVTIDGFGQSDLDLGIYRIKPDGSKGDRVTGSGNAPGEAEVTTIGSASGKYLVVLVPFAAVGQSYNGKAEFVTKRANPTLAALNKKLGNGPQNFRASHDKFNSHSEPSIAMDPLNHNHLIAGSKMYENLAHYLFKAGTYESFDGGRHWKDLGQLPGYCQEQGQCDPNDEEHYRTVSDISMAFDDEGNAYAQVLDAPGGTAGFTGFNMTIHIKKPGEKQFSDPITVHDNRNTPITEELLLDDKNWLAIDNNTQPDGSANKPRDGKIGTMYVCWSFDGSQAPTQQIVLMRSEDGGQTWGGVAPGDNTPIQLSAKGAISGIGCHESIAQNGDLYVTWYDNQIDALMQVKSTDHGHTFSPPLPVAQIVGVNEQFPGQSFRNLSIPSTGIDKKGNLYIVVASQDAEGAPVAEGTSIEQLKELRDDRRAHVEAEGDSGSGADIVLFKSTDGGQTYTGPVRVNQDAKTPLRDQFQPWLAVTDSGQLNIMYFDRRNDRNNFFIDTFLSRSNDGGKTFRDTRVGRRMWDPRLNPPISVSGEFIGDYQGIAADDSVAIPFWNSTQDDSLSKSNKEHSPYQEVYAARIPNSKQFGGPGCRDRRAPSSKVKKRSLKRGGGRLSLAGTSRDRGGCAKNKAKSAKDRGGVRRVFVSIAKLVGNNRCRFLTSKGTLARSSRKCSRPILLRAKGGSKWQFSHSARLPRGKYHAVVRAVDKAGNKERPAKRNIINFRVR